MPGSLIVIGTGIQFGHITLEAKAHIEQADIVLYLVLDLVTETWIREANPNAESLQLLRREHEYRSKSYERMSLSILSHVRSGSKVCAVFYGHPGVGVNPARRAIQLAREEGFQATMLPGISAEDCLLADLGVDSFDVGCQSYEATRLLRDRTRVNVRAGLVLWQIAAIGNNTNAVTVAIDGLKRLRDYLVAFYGARHKVVVYEAAQYVVCAPDIYWVSLEDLAVAPVTQRSTLYVPPRPLTKDKRLMRILRWGRPARAVSFDEPDIQGNGRYGHP